MKKAILLTALALFASASPASADEMDCLSCTADVVTHSAAAMQGAAVGGAAGALLGASASVATSPDAGAGMVNSCIGCMRSAAETTSEAAAATGDAVNTILNYDYDGHIQSLYR